MDKVAVCRVCSAEFPRAGRAWNAAICSTNCRRKLDRDQRRKGVELGGLVNCSDCGAETPRIASTTKRCKACQDKWASQKSQRCRAKNPDRQRELETAAASRRRSTAEGAEAYRVNCRAWRLVPKNRLRGRVTAMMNRCLTSGKAGRSWFELVDYSLDDLKRHIERQFTKGMSWENMGEWHIDHIVPVASFSFSSPEELEFKACWSLANLRPMWAEENQRKSAKRIFLI